MSAPTLSVPPVICLKLILLIPAFIMGIIAWECATIINRLLAKAKWVLKIQINLELRLLRSGCITSNSCYWNYNSRDCSLFH